MAPLVVRWRVQAFVSEAVLREEILTFLSHVDSTWLRLVWIGRGVTTRASMCLLVAD